jgi:hypothetical protein
MKLLELYEQQGDEVAIIFGRFNPPHQGHVAAWKEAAKSPNWYVGTNKSTIGPKDPLPFDVKIKAMEIMWPGVKGHIIPEQTWWSLAAAVYAKHGEVDLKIVTDEEDSKVFVSGLQKQNGVEGRHGFYKFKSIEWRPAPRVSSATDLRAAVAANDPEKFSKAAGVAADTMIDGEKFFDLVKHYLDAQAKPVGEMVGWKMSTMPQKKIVPKRQEPTAGELLAKSNDKRSELQRKKDAGNKNWFKEGIGMLNEYLKKVKGHWALVSKSNPDKVLQYYRGPKDKKPSDEWVNKVERRVHSFEQESPADQQLDKSSEWGHAANLSYPQYSLIIDTPSDMDWSKLGQIIAVPGQAHKYEFGQSDSDTMIILPGKEQLENTKRFLDKMGLTYKDVSGFSHAEIHSEK